MNKWQKEVAQSLLDSEDATIKALETSYRSALRDINDRIRIFESEIQQLEQAVGTATEQEAAVLKSMQRSKVYQKQYQEALKSQVSAIVDNLQSKEYATIQKYLDESYKTGFVGAMYDMAGQGIPVITPINQAAAVKAILTDSKISKGLYNALGIDTAKMKRTITAEITRGISTGMMYNDIARNISNLTNAPLARAKTIARTEGHRIQQAADFDAMKAAKEKGADVVKQWDASLDGDTRPHHRKLDGQIREIDEPFTVGKFKPMYPGDFGDPAEDCNCRCRVLQRAKWALDEDELQTLKDRAEYFELDKTNDFEDFKGKYQKAEKEVIDIEAINTSATKKLLEQYEERRLKYNLNETPVADLVDSGLNPITVDYTGIPIDMAKVFDDTLTDMFDEYYTGLTKISVGSKKEMLGVSNFATTRHVNSVAQKELILNPYKLSSMEKYTDRMRELQEKGYAVKLAKGMDAKYIPTHEFAHTLVDMESPLKNYVGLDTKPLEKFRKEIKELYGAYIGKVSELEQKLVQLKKDPILLSFDLNEADVEKQMKVFKQIADAQKELKSLKISEYSTKSADEFFAEAFTQAKIGESNSEYSQKVIAIVDKYFKKPLEKSEKSDIIKSLNIGRSVGASAKNYPVKMPESNQHVKLAEGQSIEGITFAGKGAKKEIRDRFRLESTYHHPADEWQKVSGVGNIIIDGETKKAELHWYEAEGEIVEMKVKRFYEDEG